MEFSKEDPWYLKGSINFSIEYINDYNVKIIGHIDCDLDRTLDDRRSTSKCVIRIGSIGVSRNSKKETNVSLLYRKVKFKASWSVACEVVWLIRIQEDVGGKKQVSTIIKCDNQRFHRIGK